MKWKVGDKVICTNIPRSYLYKLTLGRLYIVCSIDDDPRWLRLEEEMSKYEHSCFVPATRFMKALYGV